MYCNSYSFSVIAYNLASDNPSRFRKILLERMWKLIMTIDDKIRDEKLQYCLNREEAEISALSAIPFQQYRIYKYGYLKGEEMLHSNERQIIEHILH